MFSQLPGPDGLCAVFTLPLVRQKLADLADWRRRQVRQQLSQVALGINVVPAACAGQAGKDRGGLATSLIANEKARVSINSHL